MKSLLSFALVSSALLASCSSTNLTCQSTTCSTDSTKTYKVCATTAGTAKYEYDGTSCSCSSDAAACQSCTAAIQSYCGVTITTNDDAGTTGDMSVALDAAPTSSDADITSDDGGGSTCSIVGTFSATFATTGMVSFTTTGTSGSGTFTLMITAPSQPETDISGNYTVGGNDITMTNTMSAPASVDGCIGDPAVYALTWNTGCTQVTFDKVTDQCAGRTADADGKTLTRE